MSWSSGLEPRQADVEVNSGRRFRAGNQEVRRRPAGAVSSVRGCFSGKTLTMW